MNFHKDYEFLEKIGEGSFGTVYKCKQLSTAKIYAIKKLREEYNEEDRKRVATSFEINGLSKLNHVNVISIRDIFERQDRLCIVFEYMDSDLEKYISVMIGQKIAPHVIKRFMKQLFEGLNYLHEQNLIHGDIKPNNLLIRTDGMLKIADFGSCFSLNDKTVILANVGTMRFCSPESFLGVEIAGKPSKSIDMWSCGCVFSEMILKRNLFLGTSSMDQIYKIFSVLGTPCEDSWPGVTDLINWRTFPLYKHNRLKQILNQDGHVHIDAVELIQKCLTYDPRQRISAKEALQHDYFDVELKFYID